MDFQSRIVTIVGYFQSLVYIATGIWPLIDIDSFMLVTGPKVDIWLVKTVGFLVTATGLVMFSSLRRKEFTFSIALLAFLNALFLTAIDVYYALTDVISDIYLLDAIMEAALCLVWVPVLVMSIKKKQDLKTL